MVYGVGEYKPWHGDNKSGSGTNIIFQTMSLETSEDPPKYITIVAKKKQTDYFVKYESDTWDESAETIIEDMLDALRNYIN
jgi:hypothetical protein